MSVNHTNDLIFFVLSVAIRHILASLHPLSMETFHRALGKLFSFPEIDFFEKETEQNVHIKVLGWIIIIFST